MDVVVLTKSHDDKNDATKHMTRNFVPCFKSLAMMLAKRNRALSHGCRLLAIELAKLAADLDIHGMGMATGLYVHVGPWILHRLVFG